MWGVDHPPATPYVGPGNPLTHRVGGEGAPEDVEFVLHLALQSGPFHQALQVLVYPVVAERCPFLGDPQARKVVGALPDVVEHGPLDFADEGHLPFLLALAVHTRSCPRFQSRSSSSNSVNSRRWMPVVASSQIIA